MTKCFENWRRLAILLGVLALTTISAVEASNSASTDLQQPATFGHLRWNQSKDGSQSNLGTEQDDENEPSTGGKQTEPVDKTLDSDKDGIPDFEDEDPHDASVGVSHCSLGTVRTSIHRVYYDMTVIADSHGGKTDVSSHVSAGRQVVQAEAGLVSSKAQPGQSNGGGKVCAKLVAKHGDVCSPTLDTVPANTDKKVHVIDPNAAPDILPPPGAACLTAVKSNHTDISVRPLTNTAGSRVGVLFEKTQLADIWTQTVSYDDGTVERSHLKLAGQMRYFVAKVICKKCTAKDRVHQVRYENIRIEIEREDDSFASSLKCKGMAQSDGLRYVGKAHVRQEQLDQETDDGVRQPDVHVYQCGYLDINVKAGSKRGATNPALVGANTGPAGHPAGDDGSHGAKNPALIEANTAPTMHLIDDGNHGTDHKSEETN